MSHFAPAYTALIRPLLVVVLLALTGGCSAITNFDDYRNGNRVPGETDAGPVDGGPVGDGGPGGGPPSACTLAKRVLTLPERTRARPNSFDVRWTEAGGLVAAYIEKDVEDTHVHISGWTIPPGAATATLLLSPREVRPSNGSHPRVAWGGDGWFVAVRTEPNAIAMHTCSLGRPGCAETTMPEGLVAPFAFGQQPDGFALVGGYGATTDAQWRLHMAPVDLGAAHSGSSSIDIAAAGADEYVAVLTTPGTPPASDEPQATLVWFDSQGDVHGTVSLGSARDPVFVAYDAWNDSAIAVVGDGRLSRAFVAKRNESTASAVATWSGSARPVVARGDGTFLVHTGDGYTLRRVDTGSPLADSTDHSATTSRPLVVHGEYMVFDVGTETSDDYATLTPYRCNSSAAE